MFQQPDSGCGRQVVQRGSSACADEHAASRGLLLPEFPEEVLVQVAIRLEPILMGLNSESRTGRRQLLRFGKMRVL